MNGSDFRDGRYIRDSCALNKGPLNEALQDKIEKKKGK
jgi:hypothetical protein